MKKPTVFFIVVLALGIFVILGYSGIGLSIEKEKREVIIDKTRAIEKNKIEKSTNECGELEFDKTTGAMRRNPNVDLIVTKIEITRNDKGVWVTPWIKNRCSGIISKDIHVKVENVIVTFAGLAPKVETSLGHAVGVSTAASYTVTVDYDHRITEADELNNSCTKSSTDSCP